MDDNAYYYSVDEVAREVDSKGLLTVLKDIYHYSRNKKQQDYLDYVIEHLEDYMIEQEFNDDERLNKDYENYLDSIKEVEYDDAEFNYEVN
jgi:hypothetical protein